MFHPMSFLLSFTWFMHQMPEWIQWRDKKKSYIFHRDDPSFKTEPTPFCTEFKWAKAATFMHPLCFSIIALQNTTVKKWIPKFSILQSSSPAASGLMHYRITPCFLCRCWSARAKYNLANLDTWKSFWRKLFWQVLCTIRNTLLQGLTRLVENKDELKKLSCRRWMM